MKQLLNHLSWTPEAALNPFVQVRPVNSVAVIVVTSDRGFCGAFNSNLLTSAERHIQAHYKELHQQGKVKFFCVGKKGADYFTKREFNIAGRYIGVYSNLVFGQAQSIVREVIEGYLKGEFDRVEIVYNEFRSVAQQKTTIEQFLPIPKEMLESAPAKKQVDYIYEPSELDIVNALIPKHLNFQLWRALLESSAAEEGARMAAMENATVNATELISALQLSYNKARQASITSELLEIVGGAEALKAG